jgi:hypothetical protein
VLGEGEWVSTACLLVSRRVEPTNVATGQREFDTSECLPRTGHSRARLPPGKHSVVQSIAKVL